MLSDEEVKQLQAEAMTEIRAIERERSREILAVNTKYNALIVEAQNRLYDKIKIGDDDL